MLGNLVKTVVTQGTAEIMKKKRNQDIQQPPHGKDNYWNKLIKDDNHFNVGNFFTVVTTIIGLLLLLVPLFALIIESWFNHTITTDLHGMAAYIVAVVGIFATGGFTHGWTEYSSNKFNNTPKPPQDDSSYFDYEEDEELIEESENEEA